MKSRSLRCHLLLLYLLIVLLAGIVVPALGTWFSMKAFQAYQLQRRNEDLDSLKESLTALYEEERGIWKHRRVMDILHPAPQWMGMKITLIDSSNRAVFTLPNPMPQMNRKGRSERLFPPDDEKENYEHITIQLGREKNIGTLDIYQHIPSGRFEHSFLAYLTKYTLIGAVITIIIASWLGYIVAGRLSRPVILAIERTKRIAHGDYSTEETFSPAGIRELDALTRGVEDLGRSLAGQEKLRRRLMTDVAHELRTPLTVTRTQIEAIADGILEPTPERLALCVSEMQRLGGLIEDVEALSRLEGDNLSLHPEVTDMKEFLAPVLESFAPLFEKSGINFSWELQEKISCSIDRDQFRHVIDNLLSNAMRYTNPGGSVKVKLYGHADNAVIEVRDTGIGISEKDLPNVFERFYRADESRARVTGGSGVGLAIAKAAVDAHGGEITVQSVKGEGSCFRIEIPEV